MSRLGLWFTATLPTAIALIHAPLPSIQAQGVPQNKQEAVLIVDGVVKEVFRSSRQSQADILVEIAVDDARVGPQSRNRGRVLVPAPDERIYVHLQELPGGLGHRQPPAERTKIRAFLYPRNQGGWVGSFPDWFDVTSNELAPASPDDPAPAAGGAAEVAGAPSMPRPAASALETLGIGGDIINAGGDRIVVRITSVKPDGPGAAAGFEVGDVIIGAANSPLTSLDDLAELMRDNSPVVPMIIVGKGEQRATEVKVNLGGKVVAGRTPAEPGRPAPVPPVEPVPSNPGGAVDRLGATLESVPVNGKPGWKVTSLTAGGPAQEAGFEVGDLIVGIDGRVVADLASLNRVLAQAGGQATLTVRDVRSGKSVPVKVALGAAPGAAAPANRPNLAPTATGPLGITVESVDFQEIPTLRISQVDRGSAAERAGLRVGDIVEAVNDTIVFNPEEFDSIVNQSRGTVELVLKKGNSRQKVQVPFGSR